MEQDMMELGELLVIVYGIVMGTLARAITLKVDSRQYPSYPNGVFINLMTGFIAACLGAVAIPALLTGNYVAVTFLAIAVQHFRDIRKMERDSLAGMENTEYVRRGDAYIDGISKTYEARNYISLLTALLVVLVCKLLRWDSLLGELLVAAAAGMAAIFLMVRFTKGHQVKDTCAVREGAVEVRGSELYVDGIFLTNTLGTEISQTFFREEGVGFVLTPNTPKDRITLENYGQRQAVLFEAIRSFGVRRYHFSRRSFQDGRIALAFVPIVRDREGIRRSIENTPVLESSRKITKQGRGAK